MKLDYKIISGLLTTTAIAFGVAAHAAEPAGAGCDDKGPGMGMMRGGMKMMGEPGARAEQHLAQLKSQLKLTPQQEPLWATFADKVKSEAGQGMKAMREKAETPMTAPERMAQMMGMMRERMTAMESVGDTFNNLYEALTPEQKAIADKQGVFGGGMMAPMQKRPAPQGKGSAG